jgi:hypothetical protein
MTAKWMPALLMATVSLPGWGQSQPRQHFALTAHQVAQALSGSGNQITDQQVSLLAQVVATGPSPVLDILSVKPFGDRLSGKHSESRLLVKLACHVPGTCLPFYSIVSSPEATIERTPSPLSVFPDAGNAVLKPNAGIIMRAGAHATLVMDDNRSHIQIAVISLENGIAGHRIRVASPDHKQVYVAEVVSANLLKRSY